MKKKILCSLIALVTVVALVACGQKPSGGGSGSESPSGGESTGREATNSVVVGITQDIDSLDPHNAEAAGTREVLFNMFEGLVKATPEGEIEPAVASDYVVSEDATNITFTLRDGITFCDGTPVTAEDVKYSIERYAGIQGEGSAFSILKDIVIEADGKTIQVNLSEPNTEFVYELTCAIIPQANEANVNSNPIGTGPFMYDTFIPGEKLVVKRNPYYWKAGFPYLDEVTFRIVADTDVAVTQLNAGTLDIVQYLTADQAMTLNDNFYIEDGSIKSDTGADKPVLRGSDQRSNIDRSGGEKTDRNNSGDSTEFEWQGGSKDEYNKPSIYINGNSTLYLDQYENGNGDLIFSFYGGMSGIEQDRLIFEHGTVAIKGDAGGFKRNIDLAEGSKFEIRNSDDSSAGNDVRREGNIVQEAPSNINVKEHSMLNFGSGSGDSGNVSPADPLMNETDKEISDITIPDVQGGLVFPEEYSGKELVLQGGVIRLDGTIKTDKVEAG